MGACISVGGTILKNTKHINSVPLDNSYKINEKTKSRTRSLHRSRSITILQDSSENDVFKRYRFGEELGRGEFGVTYHCYDDFTGELVACKKISKRKLRTEIDIEDVRREVEIMRNLPSHPNIVKYKDVYEDKEAVYLVMELCQGGELFDRIVARKHYNERGAATTTKTILEVVKVCHENGVIHRDLKPENFLYGDDSETAPLKAIDFGLSIFFKPGQCFSEIVGSPYYMAPELLKRNYSYEVDVWSAGVILYILLCGVPPFWAGCAASQYQLISSSADTEEGIAKAIMRGKIDFQRDPWPRVSKDAKELVKGMLHPNPSDRMTVEEALGHSWIQNAHQVSNVSLGENVKARIKQFSLMNKFKKKVLRVVADNLPQEKVAGIKQTFQMMDTDKNGNLTFEELKHGLQKLGQPYADPDVKMLMDAADVDGNGLLNCEEFVTMSVHLRKIGEGDDEQLRQAFRYFDKDESGYIEVEELREGLVEDNLGPNNDQVIRDIIFDVDLDKDGRISYQEFEAMMTRGVEWRMASRQYSRAMLKALSQRMFK